MVLLPLVLLEVLPLVADQLLDLLDSRSQLALVKLVLAASPELRRIVVAKPSEWRPCRQCQDQLVPL